MRTQAMPNMSTANTYIPADNQYSLHHLDPPSSQQNPSPLNRQTQTRSLRVAALQIVATRPAHPRVADLENQVQATSGVYSFRAYQLLPYAHHGVPWSALLTSLLDAEEMIGKAVSYLDHQILTRDESGSNLDRFLMRYGSRR